MIVKYGGSAMHIDDDLHRNNRRDAFHVRLGMSLRKMRGHKINRTVHLFRMKICQLLGVEPAWTHDHIPIICLTGWWPRHHTGYIFGRDAFYAGNARRELDAVRIDWLLLEEVT